MKIAGETVGLILLLALIRLLPFSWARRIGELLGLLVHRIDRKHRRIVIENLSAAFRGEDSRRIAQLARNCYKHLGYSFVEYLQVAGLKDFLPPCEIEGVEWIRRSLSAGRGVILVSGHCGNWELIPKFFILSGIRVAAIGRQIDNPFLHRLVNRERSEGGNRVIEKRGGFATAQEILRKGEVVGVVLDQNVSGKGGVFVEFFGRPASTTRAAALLALKSGAAVHSVFIHRNSDGVHRLTFSEEIPLTRTGDLKRDVLENTQRFTEYVERAIRSHPEQWLWMHRRWKTQPN